jgi:hypothetical protein
LKGWALLLLPFGSAWAACGPDQAPPQAAAQLFTCETFRWGPAVGATPADDASEIDSGQTYAPGFKWYWGTAHANGHVTVASDYSLSGSKILIHTTADHGNFVLNTCGGAPSGYWNVGQYFQHGFYVEFTGEWNRPGGNSNQTGAYSTSLNWTPWMSWPAWSAYEIDNPDAFAYDQALVDWNGGSASLQPNTGKTFSAPNPETGTNRYGAEVTTSGVSWWINDGANGSANYYSNPMYIYNSKQCIGLESTVGYTLTVDSVKVWQVAPPPSSSPAGGTRGLRLGGR